MSMITLTTDFGLNDWFVGSMKGVILSVNPRVTIVDIAHGVPSGDIRAGAIALSASCRLFPPKTVHVAVVDPGVGSARAALAVETEHYVFLGPDNGLLSLALSDDEVKKVHRIENQEYFRHPVSPTFHGRDIFAPVAAHLSQGLALRKVGPEISDYVRLEMLAPEVEVGKITGQVVYIDRFGNAYTNITPAHLGDIPPEQVELSVRGRAPFKLGHYFQETDPGHPIGIIGSSGFLEICVNGGDAAKKLHLKIGDPVIVQ